MKTTQRPKSAVLLSVPYNFQNKHEAVDIKQKVKQSLLSFESQSSLDYNLCSENKKQSNRSYIDNGPSLLNVSAQHYSFSQNMYSSIRSLKMSRPKSAVSLRKPSKQSVHGLESFKRLKPCRTISQKTLHHLEQYFQDARKQTNFIDRIFDNISPRNGLVKKPQLKNPNKFIQKKKENLIQITGKNNLAVFQQPKIKANFVQDTPYKTNVFQPTLQRKTLQLFKKSKAYLIARG